MRWKIENSWGDDSGNKGYFVMTTDWFREYVFNIVLRQEFVNEKLVTIWKTGKVIELEPWDPIGGVMRGKSWEGGF